MYVFFQFKTKGGSQVRQYCDLLTKDDCRRQSGSFIACDKVSYEDDMLLLVSLISILTHSLSIGLSWYT